MLERDDWRGRAEAAEDALTAVASALRCDTRDVVQAAERERRQRIEAEAAARAVTNDALDITRWIVATEDGVILGRSPHEIQAIAIARKHPDAYTVVFPAGPDGWTSRRRGGVRRPQTP